MKPKILDRGDPSSPELRADALAEAKAHQARLKAIETAIVAIIDAHPEIAALRIEQRRLRAERELATRRIGPASSPHYHRFAAYRDSAVGGLGFRHIVAEADSRKELLAKLGA